MLYLREFNKKELVISFSKQVIKQEEKLKEGSNTEKEIVEVTDTVIISPTFRLNTSQVKSDLTVFSFISKAQTILALDSSRLPFLFEDSGISIEVRKIEKDSVEPKYEWSNTFPKLLPNDDKFIAASRDLVLCSEFFKLIQKQYEKDIEKVDKALFEEFENFQ